MPDDVAQSFTAGASRYVRFGMQRVADDGRSLNASLVFELLPQWGAFFICSIDGGTATPRAELWHLDLAYAGRLSHRRRLARCCCALRLLGDRTQRGFDLAKGLVDP